MIDVLGEKSMAKTDSSTLSYFDLRNVTAKDYSGYKISKFIIDLVLTDKNFRILDSDCGHGALLLALHKSGYKNSDGADIGGDIGEVFSKLADVNCKLWHQQEFVYEFDKVPAAEKDGVVKKLALLNLERNKCIDQLDRHFRLLIEQKRNHS
jgi:hypothetical protein